jgi:hypothetical protein
MRCRARRATSGSAPEATAIFVLSMIVVMDQYPRFPVQIGRETMGTSADGAAGSR